MGLIDFNVGSDIQDPQGYKERAKAWTERHRQVSLVSGVVLFFLIVWNVLPMGFLMLLPGNTGKYALIVMIAELPAFYAARYIKKKFWTKPIDEIVEFDLGKDKMVQRYYLHEGLFPKRYDIGPYQPVTWTNHRGRRVYLSIRIDKENKKAYTSWWGDLNPAELMRKKKNWERQQAWEKSMEEKASQIGMMLEEITEEASYHVTNRLYRKSYKALNPEVADEVIDNVGFIEDSQDEEKDKDLVEAVRDKLGMDDDEEIQRLPENMKQGLNNGNS